MVKALCVFASLVIVSAVGAAGNPTTFATTITDQCLQDKEVWGSEDDGYTFYFCHPVTNDVVEATCPAGKLFMSTAEVSGCIPFERLHNYCDHQGNVVACSEDNLMQPQFSDNPTELFMCLAADEAPTRLQCSAGKAFANHDGRYGCYNWSKWRSITGCAVN